MPSGKCAQKPVMLQSENDLTDRESDDVGVRSLDPAHREGADALNGVASGLVRSLAARDVALDFFLVEGSNLYSCAHGFGVNQGRRARTDGLGCGRLACGGSGGGPSH